MYRQGNPRCGPRLLPWSLSVLCALCLGTGALEGQSPPEIGEGSRVRVRAPEYLLQEAMGTVLEVTEWSLVLSLDDDQGVVTVPRQWITTLDVSVERRSRSMNFALKGALGGAALGAGMGFWMGDDSPPPPCTPTSTGTPIGDLANSFQCGLDFQTTAGDKARVLAVVVGSLGGVIGLLAGSDHPEDVWVSALDDIVAVRVSVEPIQYMERVGLTVRVAF